MRKLFLLSFVGVVVAAGLAAQNLNQPSLQSSFSYGVFQNEIDAAASVDETGPGPGFSDLESRYLFGGLANLELVINRGGATATLGNPLTLGYYVPGDRPWSVFTDFYAGDFVADVATTVTYPGTLQTKTLAGGDQYDFEDQVRVSEPRTLLAREANFSTQYLTSLGSMNVGIYARFLFDDAATYDATAVNFVAVDTYYYDADAGDNTVAPDVQEGYTTTDENRTFDGTTSIIVGVPLFMSAGDLSHLVNLHVDLAMERTGSIDTFAYSDIDTSYPNPITFQQYATVNRLAITGFETQVDAEYELTLPAIYADNDANELTAGLMLGADLLNFNVDELQEFNDIEYVVGSAKTDRLNRRVETTTETRAAIGFDISAMGSHSFYYDLAEPTRFGIIPTARIGFSMTPDNPNIVGRAEVDSTDGNDDGDFVDAADSVDYTTDDYTNYAYNVTTDTFVPQEFENVVWTSFSLPVALSIAPEGWVFGLTVGAEPELEYRLQRTITAAATNSRTTSTEQGDGVVTVAETTASEATIAGYTVTEHIWNATVAHNIGMNFAFDGGVKADVSVNFTNFLELDDLTAQVIVPLN